MPVGATFLARPFGSKTVHPPLVIICDSRLVRYLNLGLSHTRLLADLCTQVAAMVGKPKGEDNSCLALNYELKNICGKELFNMYNKIGGKEECNF